MCKRRENKGKTARRKKNRREFLETSAEVLLAALGPAGLPAASAAKIRGTKLLLSHAQSLYGTIASQDGGWLQRPGRGFPFPSVARLTPHPGKGPWSMELEFRREEFSQIGLARREIEDFGVWLRSGLVQVWWGGPRAGGVRVTVLGRTIAANPKAVLNNPSHKIGLSVSKSGYVTILLDGQVVINQVAAGVTQVGWMDISARNTSVLWTNVTCSFDSGAIPRSSAETKWQPLAGEPPFSPYERIVNGYQPFPTHLWNRWLCNFIPGAGGWPGHPFLDTGGESLVTHGPILG